MVHLGSDLAGIELTIGYLSRMEFEQRAQLAWLASTEPAAALCRSAQL